MDAITVSVVITTRGQPESLAHGLAAVLAQRFDAQNYEVIVVDETGSDETREVVEALAPHGGAPAVRYLRGARGRGLAVARNLGWRAAHGALLVFIDHTALANAALGGDWLAGGVQAMQTPPATSAAREPVSHRQADFEMLIRCLQPVQAGTVNGFSRRDVLERVGGFDPHLIET